MYVLSKPRSSLVREAALKCAKLAELKSFLTAHLTMAPVVQSHLLDHIYTNVACGTHRHIRLPYRRRSDSIMNTNLARL